MTPIRVLKPKTPRSHPAQGRKSLSLMQMMKRKGRMTERNRSRRTHQILRTRRVRQQGRTTANYFNLSWWNAGKGEQEKLLEEYTEAGRVQQRISEEQRRLTEELRLLQARRRAIRARLTPASVSALPEFALPDRTAEPSQQDSNLVEETPKQNEKDARMNGLRSKVLIFDVF